ncbi:hypothetical protein SAMN05216304_109141 [Bosea sp. OK403]|uniref:hypothetical protein n=1 Tax=Bosea sp. OK403 TaxID=1855286 RepID=UPI0008F2B725|nr:hypothetical protein [Bosea sp. OK403]SFJ54866.1 hypothetical protein SAMN05216304_109141 [Bosea sp. OK403]
MTAALAALAALRRVPWQAWAVAALGLALGLYGWSRFEAGGDAARSAIQHSNDKARKRADDASRTVENCMGAWDRARGFCLPDDGAGR